MSVDPNKEPTEEKGFDFKKTIATGLIFGVTFFGINKVLGRFFKSDED